MSHEVSPPIPAPLNTSPDVSPPLSGEITSSPGGIPTLTSLDSGLRRDQSLDSHGSSESRHGSLPRNKSSVDRLRQEVTAGSSRATSPSSTNFAVPFSQSGPSDDGSSQGTSPHPSSRFTSRHSTLSPHPNSRPYSIASLSSSRHLHPGLAPGGAPHQRAMQLHMPQLLGATTPANDYSVMARRSVENMQYPAVEAHRIDHGELSWYEVFGEFCNGLIKGWEKQTLALRTRHLNLDSIPGIVWQTDRDKKS